MMDPLEKQALFERIVTENAHRIHNIASNGASRDSSKDLEQDILLALWRSLDRYEGRSSLATWFYAVAINTAKDWKRRKRNAERPRRVPATVPYGTHPRTAGQDAVEVAEEFARSLGDLDRYIFQMFLDDLSYREMSLATGVGRPG